MRNLNEVFRKDVTYDDIKSHKKAGFHSLIRRQIFEKTTGEVKLTLPPPLPPLLSRFRVKSANCHFSVGPKLFNQIIGLYIV